MNTMKSAEIIPKTNYYHSDGTGRDSYIVKDNGGCIRKHYNQAPLSKKPGPFIYGKSRPQTALTESKIKHYLSDGTGRDSYIIWTDGGQSSHYSCNTKNVDTNFNNSLRNYQRVPFCTQQDFFSMAQGLKSKQEFYKNSRLIKPQNELILRLSQPKQQLFSCPKDKTRQFQFSMVGRSMPLIEQKSKYYSRRNEL